MATASRIAAYRYGLRAETLCVWMLRLKGYRILARRARNAAGEIDLIARKGGCIIFIEVKARRSLEEGLYAIGAHQQQRIIRAAGLWIAAHSCYAQYDQRIDLMVVSGRFRAQHLRNAFQSY